MCNCGKSKQVPAAKREVQAVTASAAKPKAFMPARWSGKRTTAKAA